MADAILDRILAKTDDELLEMLLDDSADYREDALACARQELERRGVPLERRAPPPPVLTCPRCDGTQFEEPRAAPDGSDAGTSARVLKCITCGRIDWFVTALKP